MRILSIDFDYFQKVSEATLSTYPDGHDFGSEMSMFIWGGHYTNPREAKLLREVEVDKKKLDKVIAFLKTQHPLTKVMVAQSHVHLAKLVTEDVDKNDELELVNLDMHHDTFGNEETSLENVDCGNWGNLILNTYPNAEITWVNQERSDMYGKGDERLRIEPDLNNVLTGKYDAIFICRSDIWLPPHLDKDFNRLWKAVCKQFAIVTYDKQIAKPRDMSVIEERAKIEREYYKQNFPEQYKRMYEEEPEEERE